MDAVTIHWMQNKSTYQTRDAKKKMLKKKKKRTHHVYVYNEKKKSRNNKILIENDGMENYD